ncbi:hypothetical protein C2S53_000148 [Perilla frutescens var. hirtella]|uniref:Protein kinase domain-containing protein n=1 Tax=Perilla frutescens var. hirtella TaxID=608512 RepID=A0AAD4IYA7_PERFH|nr:hypothetical protein C2S53_000148 [Perilla frutescens var. hirtella]
MKFKTALTNADPALANWNPSAAPPCTGNKGNWAGVLCFNGYVWGLQLDNIGLQGQIDVDALMGLRFLRTLSFMNNGFHGAMPDWRKLPTVKSLYLSGNQFSGVIADDAFDGMTSLKKFSGGIPAVDSENLKVFNVSNNLLEGPVPPPLLKLDPSSFTGNKALCGNPGGPSCDPPIPPPDMEPIIHPLPNDDADDQKPASARPPSSSSPARIIIIILSVILGLFLILLLLLLCWRCRDSETLPRQQKQGMTRSEMMMAVASPYSERSPLPLMVASPGGSRGGEHQQQAGKLSFVRDDRQKFDLQDLMRASAEVLGCGNFGASYKAVLVDGEALVVKRFKQMNNVAKEEFHEHMRRLGRLKHPNLLPLVAYLYRKEEKLLVFDFVSNNSLGKHLHDDGKRAEEWPKPLNWPCRLKIIKGVVKGLAYLYSELPSLNVPHGHLKSSNVLLDNNYNALLMDYTLGPVVNPAQVSQALVAYKCPEFAQTGRTSKKTDVWCLGILIMETLTGKPVANYLGQGSEHYGVDLARWVNGIVDAASTKGAQVLDKEMEVSNERSRLEIDKLLQIGIACCREDLDRRLDLEEALRRIEQVME